MHVVVNGKERALPEGSTVADAVALLAAGQTPRVAVARNGEVVRRPEWADTPLADGDRLEVLSAIQGGAR